MKKRLIYIIIVALILASCIKSTEKTENSTTEDSLNIQNSENSINADNENSSQWIGDYKGILPCEDCDGIETLLSINDDKTYFLKMDYIGKGEPIVDKGIYTLNEDGTIITIYFEDENTQQYLIGDSTLTVIDSQGKVPEGELANDYVLKKMN